MPIISVNDIDMYYHSHGKGEPLFLIAGFAADHRIWEPVIDKFSQNYQVIVFDNRGAGQTDVPNGPYSIEQLANDVAALCSALSIPHAHFIGNSMGGFILQTLAYQHPNLVKSAIICNSTLVTQTSFNYYLDAHLEFMKANAPDVALIKASCCWAFSFQFLSQANTLAHLIQMELDNPNPFTITGYEAQYAAINNFDSHDWANQINVPTLVIGANQDLIFLEPSIKALATKIPHADYYCFENCGHLPHMEYPDLFVEVVNNFIKQKLNTA